MTQMQAFSPTAHVAPDRRLVVRVHDYWRRKSADKAFPPPGEICRRELGEDWAWCFLLDLETAHPMPLFEGLGGELAKFSGIFLSGKNDWSRTVLEKVTDRVCEVSRTGEPVFLEDELVLFNRQRLLFRGALFPLGACAVSPPTHVLGTANGKLAARG